jgi:CTD small phosphatase-like protein 2
VCLPPTRHPGRPTLALDLDETLVHCTVDPVPNPDHIFSVVFNDVSYRVYVRKRPYLQQFLELVSQMFEVCTDL